VLYFASDDAIQTYRALNDSQQPLILLHSFHFSRPLPTSGLSLTDSGIFFLSGQRLIRLSWELENVQSLEISVKSLSNYQLLTLIDGEHLLCVE